jgi:cell fate regulator YaaT (PSP1 superfamily)/nitrite reductase/ring-hydroxylating ferredoxin subunit
MSYYTNIRYGKMRMVARFKTDREDLRTRDRCVVRTDRGKEVGEVLSPLQPLPETLPPESLWDVVRRAAPEDLVHAERLEKESVPQARKVCRDLVQKLSLPMKITDVDYVWGGERIVFYFTSSTRVDFRELVRQLAHEFRTRIELKQVGARDEARLVGDAGHCGLELCCRGHLKELGGITMDMAKIQKHTADPSKITGRCGKLLCCLRYEYTTYTESRDVLPQRGVRLETKKVNGVVVDQNLLLREVTLLPDGGGDRVIVKLDEILGAPAPVAGCSGCEAPRTGSATPPAAPADAALAEPALAAPAEEAPPAPALPDSPEAPRPPAPETRTIETAVRRKISEDTKVQTKPLTGIPMWVATIKTGDVAPGAHTVHELGGPKVAIFNVDGVFHVISNECGHQGGPLGEGKLEGFAVTCPWHQWKFDVTTGHCLSVSGSSVRRYECTVLGDDLFVRV